MKIKNIGSKIIGLGDVTVLPGEAKDVPPAFETSPVLEIYKRMKIAEISGKASSGKAVVENDVDEAEALRLARLASLEGISDEELGKLANELGINPASCKDQADVLKKVKAALKK